MFWTYGGPSGNYPKTALSDNGLMHRENEGFGRWSSCRRKKSVAHRENGRLGVYLVSMTQRHNVESGSFSGKKGIRTNNLKIEEIDNNRRRDNNLGRILDSNPTLSARFFPFKHIEYLPIHGASEMDSTHRHIWYARKEFWNAPKGEYPPVRENRLKVDLEADSKERQRLPLEHA